MRSKFYVALIILGTTALIGARSPAKPAIPAFREYVVLLTADAEVGAVGAFDGAEHIDVEAPCGVDVLDVEGDVVQSERSHRAPLSRR